jgi:small subunit ribosomal protein S3Ae
MLKKEWYTVVLPKAFGEEEYGEIMAADPKTLINRRIEASMNEISKDMSKFYIKVVFRIDNVTKDKALTRFDGHRILREYISHIVRPRVTRVDSNIVVTTKDGVRIRVKGLLLFSQNVNRVLKGNAIKIMNKIVADSAAAKDFDAFARSMVSGELASEIKTACRKLYPVSKAEIRKSEVQLNKQ